MSEPRDTLWILSDGAAGNRRQADALADAFACASDAGPADAARRAHIAPDAPGRRWQLHAPPPWRWLAPRRWPGSTRAFGPEFAAALRQPPRLAIGCGRRAALATRLLRERGSRVIQILDPRIDPRHWDALVVPAHDRLRGDNVITLDGSLHPIDDAWLARGRAERPWLGDLPGPRTLLLLGGPVRTAPLDAERWMRLADMLEQQWQRDGGSLLISGSRRTPDWLASAARALLPAVPGTRWFGAGDGDNPYPSLLGWADRIVVTPDSVNLLSEACATRAPVLVPIDDRLAGRHAAFVQALLARRRIAPLAYRIEQRADPITPLRELPRVVDELHRLLHR